MTINQAVLSALSNLLMLFVIPFVIYFAYHRWRHGHGLAEVAGRAGLRIGEARYLLYSLGFAAVIVAIVLAARPPLEPFLREGSSWQPFGGLGFSGKAVAMSLLYGVVKTGFPEEFLFRGLIAGSLARRLPLMAANVIQALVFLAPHLLLLSIMPEMWGILLFIFAGSMFLGWVRIKSGSVVGPWIIHAATNVTMALGVAIRSAG